MDLIIPRCITSSAISRPVQCVMGRSFGWAPSKGDQLAALLCGNLRGPSWSGSITEPFSQREILQSELLPPDPAHAPTPYGIHIHAQFSGYLPVVFALSGQQDHSSSQSDLLGGAVPTYYRFQLLLLSLAQFSYGWFRASHFSVLPGFFLLVYHRRICVSMY
jgi:hypothetical protein